jgi:hypothetical protein
LTKASVIVNMIKEGTVKAEGWRTE